jgi:ribokinase
MPTANNRVAVLGIFAADLTFRAERMPHPGETLAGSGFNLSLGGKGSNQAIAAARAGADVTFISRIGQDSFGDNALAAWARDGITPRVIRSPSEPTGAAFIFVDQVSGENAIIVYPGAALSLSAADVEEAGQAIEAASVFITQLEQPIAAAKRGLEIARAAGVTTIFNPAPYLPFDPAIYSLSDYITPNETEAAAMTGVKINGIDEARTAGDVLLSRGVGTALITLGSKGALLHSAGQSELIPAFSVGPVVETTGAGDAFNAGFAAAIARGSYPVAAARFGSATAGISVTRAGAAPSMPTRTEIEALLALG